MSYRYKERPLLALRRANPRNRPGFDSQVREHAELRNRIVATNAFRSDARQLRHPAGRGRSGQSAWWVPATGAVAVSAAVFVAIMLFSGGNGAMAPTPALAGEAVKKAAADTTAVAQSGVASTVLTRDGTTVLESTFSWNGENLTSRVEGDSGFLENRYVDGLAYERSDGQWVDDPSWTNTAANLDFDPRQLLLVDLIGRTTSFSETSNDDGSTTYAGTASAEEISSLDVRMYGLPLGVLAEKAASMSGLSAGVLAEQAASVPAGTSTVAVAVTVGSDGLLRQVALTYESEGVPCSYTANYSQVGTAPPIDAPVVDDKE